MTRTYRLAATTLAAIFSLSSIPAPLFADAPPPAGAPLPANTGISWKLSPDDIKTSCAAALKTAGDKIKTIDAQAAGQSTLASGVAAVEVVAADLNDTLIAQSFLSQTAADKAVRDASNACNQQAANFGVELGADPKIYAMAEKQHVNAALTSEADRKLVELYVDAGRRSGAGLDDATRAQVTKLFDHLNDLQRDFGVALAEDKTTIAISKAEAASLPHSFLATLTASGSGYLVPVNEGSIDQFLPNETSGAARQRYYRAYYMRGGQKNVQRLEEAIAVRDQLAHLLGFPTWAAYGLDAKMAKTPERVTAFLSNIDAKLLTKAKSEIAVLAALKRSRGDRSPFRPWDYSYYERKLVKSKYAVDDAEVRQYFPVEKVIAAVLGIYQKMLSVRFQEITPPDAWAPEVKEFSIVDAASGTPIGWFYLDLYPRPGKYGHFANFGLRPGRVLPDGSYQRPVSSIVGNWPLPEAGKPALLSHDEVVTFFHEFGHCMHGTLSKAKYETLYGTNVRTDFVEAPSQMLENWMWQPSILKEVSSNVKTGAPLPDALIAKMIALKHVDDGVQWTTQDFYATFDMTIHSAGAHVDTTKTWFDLRSKLTAFSAIPGTYPQASFGHLMGGYDAGYYSYMWSKVFAQDMFTKFQAGGLESPVVGMQYRTDILEPGATEEPDQLMQKFLGRPVSFDAFYKDIGITK
ncbi:MAG TPA: M3 family metallopeptidase [Candidatus Tumulicola sp.]|nr:M3 family metallopeptidase [Candidatus Tumulicola sp.]